MNIRIRTLILWVLMLGVMACATSTHVHPPHTVKGRSNRLLPMVLRFGPQRAKDSFDHTLVKTFRGGSDCQPNCPQVDIWQYAYRPKGHTLIKSTKPISTLQKHWKVPHEARILSTSLFGTQAIYYEGITEYLDSFEHIKKVNRVLDKRWGYETFTVRVYVAKRNPINRKKGRLLNETPDKFIDQLVARGVEVVFVDNGLDRVYKDATFWRFMVLGEVMPAGQTLRYVIRDADWRISAGELYSVGEWIHMGQQFHRMQFVPVCMSPVTASLWGGQHTGKGLFADMKTAMEYYPYRSLYGDDEAFIRDFIWPKMKASGSILTHTYPKGWVKNWVANPYQQSCEEPTQDFCKILNKDAKCIDKKMPDNVQFPVNPIFVTRDSLTELKKHPEYFEMHLETERGQKVYRALLGLE